MDARNEASSETVEQDNLTVCSEPRCGGSWCMPHVKTCKVGMAEDKSERTCKKCYFVGKGIKELKRHKC